MVAMGVRIVVAGVVGAALVGGGAPASASVLPPVPSVPIPQNPNPGVPSFIGAPAVADPLPPQSVPGNPFMAPNGRSNIHDDTWMTDTYAQSGPLGNGTAVSSTYQNQECASVTFDAAGRLVTVCVGVTGPTLEMLDPVSLDLLAAMPLPPRQATAIGPGIFTDFGSGGYFYLDNQDRAVVPTTTRHVLVVAESDAPLGFTTVRDYDLSSVVGSDDELESALPSFDGQIWFVSTGGVVGEIDPSSGAVRTMHLPSPELIGNSFAADETGGVYIVSNYALYRFVDGPTVAWRSTYDRGTRLKPGQANFGSGTTPTITAAGLVAITDNADPQMHVVAYRRDTGAEVCEQAVFDPGTSDTENSLIAAGDSLLVENNYGYSGPSSTEANGVTSPGIARVDVDAASGTCSLVWTAPERAPSVVAKVSLGSGLLYTYTKDPASSTFADPWYLTAISVRTGTTVFKVLGGTGLGYNNNYAPVSIGPDGTAYVGVLGGLVRFHDGVSSGPVHHGSGHGHTAAQSLGAAAVASLPSTAAASPPVRGAAAAGLALLAAQVVLARRRRRGVG